MSMLFTHSAVWQLVQQSDWVSKYVILLGLLVLSISCIAVIFYKFSVLYHQRNSLYALRNALEKTTSFEQMALLEKKFHGSYGGRLLKQGNDAYLSITKNNTRPFIQEYAEQLKVMMEQYIDVLVLEGEEYLPILGTSAAVSPLVGLFGTIWGLIHAFINISQEKIADISIVAPGIAEALITTLAGLIVAIPAMVSFHYFSNQLRRCEALLLEISDLFLLRVQEKASK